MQLFKMKRYIVFLLLTTLAVSLQAESNRGETCRPSGCGVTNCLSVSWSYLPTRYPRFDYDAGFYSATVNGQGLGIDYRIKIPLFDSFFELRTGLGCTYSRIDESGYDSYNVNVAYGRVDLIPPVYVNANWKTERSYCYAFLPIELAYRFEIDNSLYIVPFMGLQAKYNISYTENHSVESVTWYDYFFELFDDSAIDRDKSESKKCIPQAKAGLEIGFGKMFMAVSYSRDIARMFGKAYVKSRDMAVWGPYTLNCWQLGVGVNF